MLPYNDGKLWLKKMVTTSKSRNVINESYAKFRYMNCFVMFCIFHVIRKKFITF